MKKIYFAKKNPDLPNSEDNWIMMSYAEYCRFVETPEGKSREPYFAQLDACDADDDIYFFECSPEMARDIRAYKDSCDYLDEIEEEMGYTTFSYNADATEGEDICGEDLLEDESVNVEEDAVAFLISENLHSCCDQLPKREQDLLTRLFFAKPHMTVCDLAKSAAISERAVFLQRRMVLDNLQFLLSVQYGIREAIK